MKTIRTWATNSKTRDLRPSRWREIPCLYADEKVFVTAVNYEQGIPFRAFFIEAEYDIDGLTFSLTTQLHIEEVKK